MSAEPIPQPERSVSLPAELDNSISGTKVIERGGVKYKLTYTLERLEEPEPEPTAQEPTPDESSAQSDSEKKPVLQKLDTIVDKKDPNVKYYVYKKTYIVNSEEGPITKEQTIKRKYVKHSPIAKPREVATKAIIDELLNSEFKNKSALSLYKDQYLKLMKEKYPDVGDPYSYAAFLNRWAKAHD